MKQVLRLTANCNGTPISPACSCRRPAQLYALALPPESGETFWVDLRAAYAGLPRQLRARIAGKRAIFDSARQLEGYGRDTDKQVSEEMCA